MQEYVEIVSGGYTLRGFCTGLTHRERVPAVILFHGYSANKSNGWFVGAGGRLESGGLPVFALISYRQRGLRWPL